MASEFYAPIIGKKGATRRRMETETKARILVPKQGAGSNVVVISGMSEGAVRAAWTRTRAVVDGARAKHEFTHFISLPVNHGVMREALDTFKKECLEKYV